MFSECVGPGLPLLYGPLDIEWQIGKERAVVILLRLYFLDKQSESPAD